jgi:hypothetical protein
MLKSPSNCFDSLPVASKMSWRATLADTIWNIRYNIFNMLFEAFHISTRWNDSRSVYPTPPLLHLTAFCMWFNNVVFILKLRCSIYSYSRLEITEGVPQQAPEQILSCPCSPAALCKRSMLGMQEASQAA